MIVPRTNSEVVGALNAMVFPNSNAGVGCAEIDPDVLLSCHGCLMTNKSTGSRNHCFDDKEDDLEAMVFPDSIAGVGSAEIAPGGSLSCHGCLTPNTPAGWRRRQHLS